MSLLGRIRRNDPRVTFARIDLNDDHLDAAVTDALQQNPHIDEIYLWLPRELRNWPRLLQHLETRSNLHKVSLFWFQRSPQANITNLLHAVQRNTNVRDVKFCNSYHQVPVGLIVPFLKSAGHITDLKIFSAFETYDDSIDGPAILSASLGHVVNLRRLELSGTLQAEYLVAIFDSLRLNQSVEILSLDFVIFSDGAWDSFKNLMRRTPTIRELMVWRLPASRKETFLESVKFNFSLRVVEASSTLQENIFTDEDRRLLDFYADRNVRMDQWIEHPSTSVPENLRSHVLHVAAQAEPLVLFRSLLAIRGELGTAKRTRKRKRPAYFDPCS